MKTAYSKGEMELHEDVHQHECLVPTLTTGRLECSLAETLSDDVP
jgi:hypothetical protein